MQLNRLNRLTPKFSTQCFFGPNFFLTLIFWTKSFKYQILFWTQFFLDTTLLGLKFCGHGLFLDQIFFGPNFFLTKTSTTTITTTTTTTLMGFETIEINLLRFNKAG